MANISRNKRLMIAEAEVERLQKKLDEHGIDYELTDQQKAEGKSQLGNALSVDLMVSDVTVVELKETIQNIDSLDTLDKMIEAEKRNENRKSALRAMEKRKKELSE